MVATAAASDQPKAPPYPLPDDRFKADILLIVAHEDDETPIAAYLARTIRDEHHRVAVIYITRGINGGNNNNERGIVLGAVRETESRQALASIGVKNVWVLGAADLPAQNVLRSLEYVGHGATLEQIVRLVRLTRPAVILSWLPAYVAGENHADHQASGVIATEAFDLAGDPTAFAEQIYPGRNSDDIAQTEGLPAWQPQKIYYFSDAFDASGYFWRNPLQSSPFRRNFLEGRGPTYLSTDMSPSAHVSYARLAAEESSFYLGEEGEIAKKALETANFASFKAPVRLTFGKSVVAGTTKGDVFEGVVSESVSFAKLPGFQAQVRQGLSLEFSGPFQFYREFWKAHNLEHLAQLLPIPEVAVRFGDRLKVPLAIHNGAGSSEEVTLTVALPEGWSDKTKYSVYPVRAHEFYPVQATLLASGAGRPGWQEVTWRAKAGGREVGSVTLRVCVSDEGSEPQ